MTTVFAWISFFDFSRSEPLLFLFFGRPWMCCLSYFGGGKGFGVGKQEYFPLYQLLVNAEGASFVHWCVSLGRAFHLSSSMSSQPTATFLMPMEPIK